MVLSTLAKLESIRNKAIQDLDKLVELKTKALSDPLEFVQKLQKDPAVCLQFII